MHCWRRRFPLAATMPHSLDGFVSSVAPLCLFVATSALSAQSVTFLPRVDYGMAQENAQQCVVADFDHSGSLDIAVTMEGYNQGKVEVLYNDGEADFGSSEEFASYVAWGLGNGDFDGDGWMDLVATSYGWAQHGVRIYRNQQDGTFANSANVATLATSPTAVVAGDFDGDGILDLAAASETGGYAVDWFHGNGNATFSSFHVVPNTYGLVGRRIYAGHFDADAHLDLLLVHQQGAMVLRNDSQGQGNFNALAGALPAGPIGCAAVADLDGDGILDVITSGVTLQVWRGQGTGAFTLLHSYTANGAGELDLGDIDGDGVLDLLGVGYGGAQLFLGLGGGAFGPAQTIPTGLYPKAGAIGDWDGDGFADLAIVCQNLAGQSSFTSIYLQDPPTALATATVFGVGCGTPPLTAAPRAGQRPLLGSAQTTDLGAVPGSLAFVAIGLSASAAGSVPLPLPLAPFGLPGCTLLQDCALDFAAPTVAVGASAATHTLSVPSQPWCLGLTVYLQPFAPAPSANAAGLVVGNAVAYQFGNL